MREFGKLFRRDRRYWIVLASAILVFGVYWFTFLAQSVSAYQAIQTENSRKMEAVSGEQETVLMRDSANAYMNFHMRVKDRADLLTGVAVVLLWGFQLARWTVQSQKGGIEMEERMPIRRSSFVTYDILCGAISFGALLLVENAVYRIVRIGLGELYKKELFGAFGYYFPDYVRAIQICFMFYCIAVLGRQVSRSILGCVFFTVLHYLVIIELEPLLEFPVAVSICVCVLCYFFRGRRDIAAGRGTFVFRGVHYYVLTAVFGSLFCISMWLGDTYEIGLKGPVAMRALLVAVFVTVLSHVLLQHEIV